MHIKEGRTIVCPFKQCDKTFTVVSTFTSHLSRKHKRSEEGNLMDSVMAGVSGSSGPHGDSDSQCDVEIDAADNADHLEFSPENIEDSLF